MKIVVTGATGYIGSRLVKVAISQGYDVVLMSRRRSEYYKLSWIKYDLFSSALPTLPSGTFALIHLAANTGTDQDLDNDLELRAARLLLTATKKRGAKFIFVSSQTARSDAPTPYGLTKWSIEQEVLAAKGFVVRPGLVYGGSERGLFGSLVNVVKKSLLLPNFLPAPKIQPIHIDDFTEGLMTIVKNNVIKPRVICLASPTPIEFSHFMIALAKERVRRLRLLVPIPVLFVKFIGGLLGKQLSSRLGITKLKSLFDLPVISTESELKLLNLKLRPLLSGLHPSGNNERRRLINEGSALLCYILRTRPDKDLIRRYVRAVEKLWGGNPLLLPSWAIKWPKTIALFDNRPLILSACEKEFFLRLDAATVLAEATTEGAKRFLGLGRKRGKIISLISIFIALFSEVFWRFLRLVCAPLLRRFMRKKGD